MTIDASIYGSSVSDFTDNAVQVFYYEDPAFGSLSLDETPANIQTDIYLQTDFKLNPIERLKKYASIACRFTGLDGQVLTTEGQMVRYPISIGKPNAVQCTTPLWDLRGNDTAPVKLDIALNGQDFKGGLDFTFT